MPRQESAGSTRTDGDAIPGFGFNPPVAPVSGFEATELAALHGRMPDATLRRVHRVDFHTVTLISEGSGEHTVDFVTYPCRPGTLLWVRPGQVQRFGDPSLMKGTHLLFTPAFPAHLANTARLLDDWHGSVCVQLGTDHDYATVSTLLSQLHAEFNRRPGTVSREILQLQLAALLLHIDRLPPQGAHTDPHTEGGIYARFRAELERSYSTTRRAEDYAHHLGYTVKTLTRACLAATGQTVKQVIDTRVALQAQRLLAHTDEPVAVIARGLGFSEPANFGKFFSRHTGTTPGDFRHTHQPPTE
ncbi:AraC family transcriptional regulator [Streptomyces turgidiscabies]|uniref:Transcriptional regulator, AraC family n=1 Tax=Streptomyces turgidiscabies (strain Car8) TaxID=698760 RepID=L7EUW0_STRT8|nr:MULTISPECIES: AraC family transcriptional regulator [Streptomyces]ELP63193.1 transcriptional regulator, AraC family [Streptomyces turgidiscabies Car8]MDX3499667.1 AraC family transcriptional regulator [Streptomyces turgidiscabies]GAQ73389.1 HTH-type transcriptional activator RhaS [Streptomyces turgidiscabies]